MNGKIDYVAGAISMLLFLSALAVVMDIEVYKWLQVSVYGFLGFIYLWISVDEIL